MVSHVCARMCKQSCEYVCVWLMYVCLYMCGWLIYVRLYVFLYVCVWLLYMCLYACLWLARGVSTQLPLAFLPVCVEAAFQSKSVNQLGSEVRLCRLLL